MTDSDGGIAGLQTPGRHGVKTGWGLWAVYLGVSWTWCIGMFLPALLWRDFGVWSFAVFALPNIIGAALLGVVMRSPDASRLFLERHRAASWAFSAATVAFQVFFAAWVARIMGGGLWHAGWVFAVAAALLGVGGPRGTRAATGVALTVWVVSIMTIAFTVMREHEAGLLAQVTQTPGVLPADELLPLALVCTLGFMLCPYLDRTFHRARIETGKESQRAFGVGFGFFFALMIVGTILTAPVLLWIVGASGPSVGRLLIALVAAHTLPQIVYTCWVHGGETRGGGERIGLAIVALATGLATALLSGSILTRSFGWEASESNTLYGGEIIYRCFMAFYGLAAPAYVAIVSWPVRDGGAVINRGRLVLFSVVVVAAVWFYWLGFVERQTWWVAVGVGIVVAGKLISRFFDSSLRHSPKA